MAHIHKLIDFTVVVYIVHNNRVLLVDHKEHNMWLPVGGHVELDEDPEQALFREITEECGLRAELLSPRPNYNVKGVKALPTPEYLDIHDINDTHKHISLAYFATSKSDKIQLNTSEHHDIRWFTKEDLDNPIYRLKEHIRFYSLKALARGTGN